MNKVLIARLQQEMRARSASDLVKVLAEVLAWEVRPGGDQLWWAIGRAKEGQPQVIGETPAEQVVVISIRSLAALLRAAADTVSLGEILDHSGFKPMEGDLKLKTPRPDRNRLSIYEPEESAVG